MSIRRVVTPFEYRPVGPGIRYDPISGSMLQSGNPYYQNGQEFYLGQPISNPGYFNRLFTGALSREDQEHNIRRMHAQEEERQRQEDRRNDFYTPPEEDLDDVNDANTRENVNGGGGNFGKKRGMFNVDNAFKTALLNMAQYIGLSVVPILLLVHGIQYFVPNVNADNSSTVLLAESVGQILCIMLALWLMNKVIFSIPTYSGRAYKGFNETTFILPLVLIFVSMQNKVGVQVQLLMDRLMKKWFQGREGYADQQQQQHAADLLPSKGPKQTSPDFNAMHLQHTTPLQEAASPGMRNEPVAANEGRIRRGSAF